jgi:hypothetical protein
MDTKDQGKFLLIFHAKVGRSRVAFTDCYNIWNISGILLRKETVGSHTFFCVYVSSVSGFLPDSMSNGTLKIVTSVLITFHVIVAYVVT